jgi:hypothetical protein
VIRSKQESKEFAESMRRILEKNAKKNSWMTHKTAICFYTRKDFIILIFIMKQVTNNA